MEQLKNVLPNLKAKPVNYYPTDPEAQPFNQPKTSRSVPGRRRQWVRPTFLTLPEEQANERRHNAITNTEVIDAVEKLSKIIGPDVAGKYFGKFFDNLNREELTPGHYETK